MTDSIKYLTPKETIALFKVIKSPRDRAIFTIAYFRGLRASEVGLLELNSWNRETGHLRVRRLKGSVGSTYLISPRETATLKAWLRVRGDHPGTLFPSRNHSPISRYQLDHLMKGYCVLAGIPKDKAHMHVLKHSIACMLLKEKKKDLKFIQTWLGHKNLNSTAQYLHLSDAEMDTEAQILYENW